MRHWKQYINIGNHMSSKHCYKEAALSYREAVAISRQNLCQWHEPASASTAILLSYLYLARTLLKINQTTEAVESLTEATAVFIDIKDTACNNPEWRCSSCHAINTLKGELTEILTKNTNIPISVKSKEQLFCAFSSNI